MSSLSHPSNVILLVKENSLQVYQFLKSLKFSDLGKLNRTGYSNKVLIAGSVVIIIVTST